jgi:hypothetical protein
MFNKTFSFWRRLLGKGAAQPSDATTGQDERRVWVRYPAQLVTTFRPASGSDMACLEATVRNISQGGINLVVDKRLHTGQLLSIELPRCGEETHRVLACIVRESQIDDGHWSLGCVFSSELSDEELESFGARNAAAAPSDQRKWVRYACSTRASFEVVSDPASTQHTAEVINLSANGVGLLVAVQIDPGALLNVTLLAASSSASRTMLCCVVHVTSHNAGQWALGCNFIRQLSEEDLQALL